MTVCVVCHPLENVPVSLNPPQKGVATGAQQPANVPTNVAVINEQIALHATDKTSPVLRLAHGLDVCGRQTIFTHETCAEVLSLGSFRVRCAPLAQAFIAAHLVCLGILASHCVATILAVGANVLPRLGKPIKRKAPLAFRARFHLFSMTYQRDNIGRLAGDQPCHADVLLELANA